nr:LacI family DNA-binding transcriptional regulator [Sporohalobacter salinus]
MKDVAQKAEVSIATVSHVINETRYVSENTKNKVIKAMKELDYHPNSAARLLKGKESKIIGFLVPDISNSFFTKIAKEIELILRDRGYNLIVSNSDEEVKKEKEQLKVFNSQLIDGLIMAPSADDHSFLEEKLKDYPVVFIDRKPAGYNKGDRVLVKNEDGSYNAVEHLINSGHTNIGIITGLPGLTTTNERLEGYKKALKDNNIRIRNEFIKGGNSMFDSGYKLTRELVDSTDITAIFATNNLMTVGSMNYLKENSVQIPEEIAIIGYDNYNWATITDPSLSVVKQPIQEIGKKSAELVLSRIDEEKQAFSEYRLDNKLIIRSSC